ncbi:cytochrome P450 [Aspergillus clavatus NRRL 1]|uniref:Benzoate 4-monooxygenase cytochrome P450 n=1 Tax=Aspergillus clavatus (strain ATCC 1007 / CBS 513.65 / DSM 816 / NCTC 3887 / NRRL 1 / QM 1276 / 107) TaxID=344612 RepID=A1C7G2_ASPCL|nr:benzoate 4-monooxygenase cytochrome P450 [Aspergillus clavatus NRRL 1]EAW14333.1 benzoate 4-monooxygenase cytochrome P450 [Aspergillus clavatus NRRL 1]
MTSMSMSHLLEPLSMVCGIILLVSPLSLAFAVKTLAVPVAQSLYNIYFHPLRRFPGPKRASCSNVCYLWWTVSGTIHWKLKELHDQYGEVVRISPSILVYRSPNAWRDIYGHRKHDTTSFVKDPDYYIPSPNGEHILTANDADHARERRLLSHAFSERALREQESIVQQYVNSLILKLQEYAASGSAVDMAKWYNFTTFDIIGDLAFGEPFDCLRDNRYHPWVWMIFQSAKASVFMRLLHLYPRLESLVKKMLPKKFVRMRNEHWQMSKEKVGRRLSLQANRPDFMSYILKYYDERGMSRQEIEANAGVLILAGSETTATALSGCTFYVLKNPEVYNRLVREIRTSFQRQEDITFLSVARLPYLHAALEESLRLYPPVPGILPRKVPAGGASVDGQYVPGGVTVSTASFSAARAKSNFADPDSFIPERWLKNRDPKFESDNREASQAFSLGPRNCLGKNLAYAEMRVIIAKLLWNFDLSLHSDCYDWDNQASFIIWQKPALMVDLKPIRG